MTRRAVLHRSTLFAIVAIALLIALQPLGVFRHFIEDHHDGHFHGTEGPVAFHAPDTDTPHHEADHGHVWMPPVASLIAPRVGEPQPIAALRPFGDLPQPSASPLPPFSPPRA